MTVTVGHESLTDRWTVLARRGHNFEKKNEFHKNLMARYYRVYTFFVWLRIAGGNTIFFEKNEFLKNLMHQNGNIQL